MLSGDTRVAGGTLLVDGRLGGTMNVASGGALDGDGAVLGDSAVVGTLFGRENEQLAFGDDLVLESRADNGTALFDVANDLTLDGTLNVADLGGFGPGHYRQ